MNILISLFAFQMFSFAVPDPIIIGGENEFGGTSSSLSSTNAEKKLCSQLLRVKIVGERPALLEKSSGEPSQSQNPSTLKSPSLKKKKHEGWFRKFIMSVPQALTPKKMTAEEKKFQEFLKYWKRVIQGIEASQGLTFNTDFFRNYWIHEHKLPVEEWNRIALAQFKDSQGRVVYYFFSETQEKIDPKKTEGTVTTYSKSSVYTYKRYTFGPLKELNVPELRSFYSRDVSKEEMDVSLIRQITYASHERSDEEVLNSDIQYDHFWSGEVEELILPLSENTSLSIKHNGAENEISIFEADNKLYFSGQIEKPQKLEKLFQEWKESIQQRQDSTEVSQFYEESKQKITTTFEHINQDISLSELQLILSQISEDFRNISKQIFLFSRVGLEKELIKTFSLSQFRSLTTEEVEKLISDLRSIVEFKMFHLTQLQELLYFFEDSLQQNHRTILDTIETVASGAVRESIRQGFEESFDPVLRESLVLNFEGAYQLEQQRMRRLKQLLEKINRSGDLPREERESLLKDLKTVFSQSDDSLSPPQDLELDVPVLEFIYLLKYNRKIRAYGSGGLVMFI